MLRACLLSLLLAPLALAQPAATLQPLGPLAVEIDGESTPLEPHRAAARGDGFVVLATRADREVGDANPLVVLTLDASGRVVEHRVLGDLGSVIGTPTRLQAYGDALLFAVHVNDPAAESPVKVVALGGAGHRVLLSVGSGTASTTEAVGSLDFGGTTTTRTETGFRLSDVVPLAQDLFLVAGQATQSATTVTPGMVAAGDLGTPQKASAPRAVLVNAAGQTRPLALTGAGHGAALSAAASGSEFLVTYWTGPNEYGADDVIVASFNAGFESLGSAQLERASAAFAAAYPFGEGFLLYGSHSTDGVQGREERTSGLVLTALGARSASGARGRQDVEMGQDLPREGRWTWFDAAFLGTVDGQGVVAVAPVARGEGDGPVTARRAYLGRPGDGGADRWEMEVGTAASGVRPLALSPGGVLLSAYREAYGEPWQLERVALGE